ncbi:MAG: hypothetical protein WD063_20935 [Pirellulales bacterium]
MKVENYAQLAWPGLLAILASTYVYWASQQELVSSRPSSPGKYEVPDPVPAPGVRTVHCRMWEDPISSAYQHWKALPEQHSRNLRTVMDWQLESLQKAAASSRDAADTSVRPSEGDPAGLNDWLTTLQRTLTYLATLTADSSDIRAKEMREHFRDLVDKTEPFATLCLPVFLPGSPYAEDKEKRMRIRYAVDTALSESGYHPKDSSHLDYVVPKVFVRVLRGWQQSEIVVPVKLYRHETHDSGDAAQKRPQVLVFWINEPELGLRPLLAMHRILQAVFSRVNKGDKLKIAIIGPASSDALSNIAAEVKQIVDDPRSSLSHWRIASYEPRQAQQGFSPLWRPKPTDNQCEAQGPILIFSPRATGDIKFEDTYFAKLYRVIGTDAQLARELKNELETRGALPGTVVLITEHDTLYGRKFPQEFASAFPKNAPNEPDLTFRVLRGIDGNVPASDSKEDRPTPAPKSDSLGLLSDSPDVTERPPEGRSQYDYLRRLPFQIKEQPKNRPVTAIGVVGSDVYDKLLVLRALRPQFPDCVFFTTDLDAIYTHPNERAHTRNLIIASHFGLSLGNTLQQHTPPFRDSYQTATFLATRLAIHHDARQGSLRDTKQTAQDDAAWEKMERWFEEYEQEKGARVPPLCFVVGRTSTRQLETPAVGKALDGIQPPASPDSDAWHALFVGSIVLVAVGGALLLVHRDALFDFGNDAGNGHRGGQSGKQAPKPGPPNPVTRSLGALLGLGIVTILLVGVVGGLGLDIASPLGGYSTWPRNMLYAIAGTCAVCCLWYLFLKFRGQLDTAIRAPHLADWIRLVADEHSPTMHAWKSTMLGIVLVYAGVVFVYGAYSWATLAAAVVAFAALGAALYWHKGPDRQWGLLIPSVRNNLLLDGKQPENSIIWAIGALLAITALMRLCEAFLMGPAAGWHPTSTSRHAITRFTDWLAEAFAFATVGLLFSALLYTHFWCREFSREARRQAQDWHDIDSEYDRLWLVGKLTSVSSSLLPALMALLLVLVLAYHPLLSPTPMPTGVLVMTSLAMLVFVGSALLLRRQFGRERAQALAAIQVRISAFPSQFDEAPTDAPAKAANQSRRVKKRKAQGGGDDAKATSVASATAKEDPQLKHLERRKQQIEALSDGVFQSWNQAPLGWILGGGTLLALVDWWVRGLTIAP